jgi:hypothetical protein
MEFYKLAIILKPRTTQFKREGLHHFIIEKDGSLVT